MNAAQLDLLAQIGSWRATGYAETGPSPHTNVALGTFTALSVAKGAVRDWAIRVRTGAERRLPQEVTR